MPTAFSFLCCLVQVDLAALGAGRCLARPDHGLPLACGVHVGQPPLEIALVGVGVKLQVAHEGVDRPRADRVPIHLLAHRSFLELDVLQTLLLFQLRVELLELFLGQVLLLEHPQVGSLGGAR